MLSGFLEKRYSVLFPGLTGEMLTRPLPQALRVNTLRITEGELVERLQRRGFELEKVPWVRHGYFIRRAPFSPGATPEYLLGYYYLQDPASMYACEVLDPRPGELVLDAAAAPGGKTTYIAQLMQNRGCVVAVEVNRQRIRALRASVMRLGVENAILVRMDAREVSELGLLFDRVLLDAPCTGTGTAHKAREALTKDEGDLRNLLPLQRSLMGAAYRVLRPGGVMVYATCSLLPEENELLLQDFLEETGARMMKIKHGSPALDRPYGRSLRKDIKRARRFYPWVHNTQGFFVAKIQKPYR
ncbi:MAG: RsmB/NOP family class I SAM-dependent RNA methyltransferase [Euryarchaeota archaeon]|nr:RsmB/NOP family class I SAM-dependent RNA methyltransferase [Euryarchaeota archaeon]